MTHVANEKMGRGCDPDPHRYGEDDSRPFSLNWDHYLDANKAITHFFRKYSTDPPPDVNREDPVEFEPRNRAGKFSLGRDIWAVKPA